jgi:hypothetical protein
MASTVGFALSSEQVLGGVDLAGLVGASPECYGDPGLATRAAHSMCLTSASVRAAVLASVQRVRMDAPLPVLQQMASLVSLHVSGPGPLDPSQLPRLTCLQADGISSPQVMSAIMQLTRLQELEMDIDAEDGVDMQRALQCISRLSTLSSLGIAFPKMEQLPVTIGQLAAVSNLDLGGCSELQQLPDTIGQLAALTSLYLHGCHSLQQLPVSIGQLTALSSLDLRFCISLQQLPDTIGQLTALRCT